MASLAYRILRGAFRVALRVFFRRIEVAGLERVPPSGPVILAANHANALADGLILAAVLRRPLVLTARSTLARNPLLRALFRAGNVIALHRVRDVEEGGELRKNVEALAEARARLALQAEPGCRGPLEIVPAGLHYAEKDRFRSDVWVRFGEPIDVAAWKASHPEEGHRALTEEIEERVRRLTLNFETRRDSAVLGWAAEVLATRGLPPAPLGREERSLGEHVALVERLLQGYERLTGPHANKIDALRDRVSAYRRELRRLGIAPREVYLPMDARRAARFVLREGAILLGALPVSSVGIALHLAPALAVRAVARKLSKKKDHWASNTILPGVAIFPLWYAVAIAAAWISLPPLWAAAATLLLPASGLAAEVGRAPERPARHVLPADRWSDRSRPDALSAARRRPEARRAPGPPSRPACGRGGGRRGRRRGS
ncbi:MAG: 1-acyl-sn-glycerol-3-phosphate acyltransferase [Planctomycetota bacterium]